MANKGLSSGETIGIVLTGVIFFGLITLVPLVLIAARRRQPALVREAAQGRAAPSMRQLAVAGWLREMKVSTLDEEHAKDACPICLSALLSSPYLARPEPALIQPDGRNPSPTRSHSSASPSHCEVPSGSTRGDSEILVLNKCNHTFHSACITSWFNYRCYKCPLCQTSYAPPEHV
ncbi:hypothetical protein N7474_002551 [Penicillium riverlandense]|uniref:uncharacterized protein n=1 Tax=Penicillium riverlandense TaxID=1903569 RepID=UPI002549AE04|nr:uncharacterized protein N7474_002551 [Penicillium riverlandense]KAJ5825413.1 hypothetical protein N7474_002551 [Penicillium riverlandense]